MIYPPRHVPPTWGDGYAISSRRVWLPGQYDSERAARYAFRLPDAALYHLRDTVLLGEHRLITLEDLRSERARLAAPGAARPPEVGA